MAVLKNKRVLTPQIYAKLLALACKNKAKSVDVVDIWDVPDYQAYFDGFINPNLGSYAKGKWSQLQIIFIAVDISEKYPVGVKVSHRAYSCDRVKLLPLQIKVAYITTMNSKIWRDKHKRISAKEIFQV